VGGKLSNVSDTDRLQFTVTWLHVALKGYRWSTWRAHPRERPLTAGLPMTGDNSTSRKFAPFLRRRDEQKAQTYDMWIYQQLGRDTVPDSRPVGSISPTRIRLGLTRPLEMLLQPLHHEENGVHMPIHHQVMTAVGGDLKFLRDDQSDLVVGQEPFPRLLDS
jgi:hypothetical protein